MLVEYLLQQLSIFRYTIYIFHGFFFNRETFCFPFHNPGPELREEENKRGVERDGERKRDKQRKARCRYKEKEGKKAGREGEEMAVRAVGGDQ